MDQPIEVGKLLEKLKETAKQGFDERIYVRGSKAVNYGRVAEVMSLITSAGYKIGIANAKVPQNTALLDLLEICSLCLQSEQNKATQDCCSQNLRRPKHGGLSFADYSSKLQ